MDTIMLEVLHRERTKDFALFAPDSLPGTKVHFRIGGGRAAQLTFSKISPFEPQGEDSDRFITLPPGDSSQTIKKVVKSGIYFFEIKIGIATFRGQLAVSDKGDCFTKFYFGLRPWRPLEILLEKIEKKRWPGQLMFCCQMPVVNRCVEIVVNDRRGGVVIIPIPHGCTWVEKQIDLCKDGSLEVSIRPCSGKRTIRERYKELIGMVGETGGTKTIDIIARPPRPADGTAAD